MSKGTPLTIDERKSRLENLKRLLGVHFGKITARNLELLEETPVETANAAYEKLISFIIKPERMASRAELLSRNPKTLQRNFDFLNQKLGLKPEKIASQAQLLGIPPETLQRNFDFLNQKLGLTPEKIASRAELLNRDSETLQRNFDFLNQKLGLTPEKIASRAELLGRDSETLQRNFDFLNQKLGLKPEKIAILAQLLEWDPKILQRNFDFLNQKLGIKPETIATNAALLGRDPKTLQRNFDFLNQKLGLTPEKIATDAQLLGRDPETLQRNWQNLRRYFAAEVIRNVPAMLNYSQVTLNTNRQFLAAYGIQTDTPQLYSASPQLKREKMCWISQNILNNYNRQDAISKVRAMVSRNPMATIYPSINKLDRNREKLRRLAARI